MVSRGAGVGVKQRIGGEHRSFQIRGPLNKDVIKANWEGRKQSRFHWGPRRLAYVSDTVQAHGQHLVGDIEELAEVDKTVHRGTAKREEDDPRQSPGLSPTWQGMPGKRGASWQRTERQEDCRGR